MTYHGFARSAAAIMAAIALPWVGQDAGAAAEFNWKMHSAFSDTRPETKFAKQLAEDIGKATGGRLAIEVYSGGSLGVKDADTLRWLPAGNAVQMTWLFPEYMGRDLPKYANILPVGVLNNVDKLPGIAPALREIENKTYDDWGIKMLAWGHIPLKEMQIICKEPVNTLEQLKHKKVRVFAKFHVDVFKSLGIAAQVIPQSDLYIALQTGVVDCAFYPLAYAADASLHEVAPYASYIGTDIPAPANILVSAKAWDRLPDDLKAIVRKEAEKTERKTWEYLEAGQYDKEGAAKYAAGGGKILAPFPQADQDRFVQACLAVWEQVSKAGGAEAMENYQKVKAALDAH